MTFSKAALNTTRHLYFYCKRFFSRAFINSGTKLHRNNHKSTFIGQQTNLVNNQFPWCLVWRSEKKEKTKQKHWWWPHSVGGTLEGKDDVTYRLWTNQNSATLESDCGDCWIIWVQPVNSDWSFLLRLEYSITQTQRLLSKASTLLPGDTLVI